MKSRLTFLLTAIMALIFACAGPETEPQVLELHNTSEKIGEDVAKMVEALSQQKNSINVQGRALTDKEASFTNMVSSLEDDFSNWQKNMNEIAKLVPDEKRMALEKTLHDALLTYKTKAEELTHTKMM